MSASQETKKVIGVIPARFGSQRLPGKPLLPIKGKPLIQHTWENARKAKNLSALIIATDDERIKKAAEEFGALVVMTPEECPTGSDRIAWVSKHTPLFHDAEIIVNIQGDEPDINPAVIEDCVDALIEHPDASLATAVVKIHSREEAESLSVVKCVRDAHGYALYFSRALIPHSKNGCYCPDTDYFKHIGIYAYKKPFLDLYPYLPKTPLQLSEDLEQLRVLETGHKIITILTEHDSLGIDTEQDLRRKVERTT
ncbi:3-deoxy-manno-octulosonate cytidylyltransferase [Estrella lausannensis]|uniref:3-deoxy-manno-octulosonate cytidylyltransferase n=1 Tax=Estrella lausannensis TaxID=483423 RepID=A0A0H5DQ36_9BACT|nr:3-deoxy-manno-octulosonate cytidylyltransferase [Estrella lausannensis]CRX38158.1 3-deoxy-manno-octulosonate cytidylyltransferase [Estrella lausannensis]